jgi:ribose-phosphate pyrophosphokinase
MPCKIYTNDSYPFSFTLIPHTTFKFPGGEIGVKILRFSPNYMKNLKIVAHLRNSDDIWELIMLREAANASGMEIEHLYLPYVPYARQDRSCDVGEGTSIKAFSNVINSLEFDRVTILDPHSDVTPALIKNCHICSQAELLCYVVSKPKLKTCYLVSPDAGAEKKIYSAAKLANPLGIIKAAKKRNPSTGEIVNTQIVEIPDTYNKENQGATALIVDDICDGGRTFIELAKELKDCGISNIELYITHGIFSKGLAPLYEAGIQHIYCANPWITPEDTESKKFTKYQHLL